MACNNSGVWNEEGDFLDFSIAPAFYQTNWFRVLAVRCFLGPALRGSTACVFSNCGGRKRRFLT